MFVVFDYDGVIINSLPAVHVAVNELRGRFSLPPISEADMSGWLGPSMGASIKKFCQEHHVRADQYEAVEKQYFDLIVKAESSWVESFPGTVSLLSELRMRGVPLALATMKSQMEIDACTQPLPGLDFFDVIICPKDNNGVPKEQLVSEAMIELSRRGVDLRDGVMVGDRGGDIEAGFAKELRTIGVLWGSGSLEELKDAGADTIVDSVEELRSALLNT